MTINGQIASDPVSAENRIKFVLTNDDTMRPLYCMTELDFGQFGPINRGDSVTLTGAMVLESLDGYDNYFCADSINPAGKGARRTVSHI